MTAVDELLAFVRACLDEDERVALAAVDQGGIGRSGEKHWHRIHSDHRALIGDMAGNVVIHGIDETWSPSSYQAEHIVRWDPARVLAKIKADRAILDWCERGIRVTEDDCYQLGVDDVVRLLAQPYAGRPGWREEWRA